MKNLIISRGGLPILIIYMFAIFFATIPPYLDFRVHENIGLNLQRAIIIIAITTFAALAISRKSTLKNTKLVLSSNKFISYSLALYLVFRLASYIYNPSQYSLLLLINEVMMNAFVFLFFSSFLSSFKQIRHTLNLFIFSALIVSIITFQESLAGVNFLASFADTSTTAGMVAAETKSRDGYFRAQGTFEHPLALAQYFLIIFPLLFSKFIFSRSRTTIALIAITVLIAANLTRVRTFYVSLLFGLAFYSCVKFLWSTKLKQKTNTRFLFLIILAPVLSVFIGYNLYAFLFLGSHEEISSTMTRLSQLYNGIIAISESPYLGHGIGTSKEVIINVGLYHAGGLTIWNETIDNLFLSIALDSGVPALLCLIMLMLGSITSGVSLYKNNREPLAIRETALLISTSLVSALVSMMVLSIFTVLPFIFALMGLNCAIFATSKSTSTARTAKQQPYKSIAMSAEHNPKRNTTHLAPKP